MAMRESPRECGHGVTKDTCEAHSGVLATRTRRPGWEGGKMSQKMVRRRRKVFERGCPWLSEGI